MELAVALPTLLRRQAGVLTVAQAVACLGRHAVAWRLQSDRWQRRHPRVLIAQSHSLPEREFACLVRRRSLPPPSHQAVRPDATGKRRYLDFAWARYATRVEIDGSAHLEVVQNWADCERDNQLQLVVEARSLRFPAYAVRHHPERVGDLVERALRLGGWTGSV